MKMHVRLTIAPLAAALTVGGAQGSAHPASRCVPGWRVVPSPAVSDAGLIDVAASSPSDAWAVGYDAPSHGFPFVVHWNGSRWSVMTSPEIAEGELNAVAAISQDDAWAVGDVRGAIGIIEHWGGGAWRRVAAPAGTGPLFGVSAVSGRDVWAVGGDHDSPVTVHWDGTRWRRIPVPVDALLSDVVAVSELDVWAVGSYRDGLFAMHWDGRRWHPFAGPNVADQGSWLNGVTAVSSSDVWAVGEAQNGLSLHEPVVYRWNGMRWKTAKAPFVDGGATAIVGLSATDLWTLAWDDPVLGGGGATISHWNGKSWRSEEPQPRDFLAAVAPDKGTHLWAVGSTGNALEEDEPARPVPLIERYGC
jgi:hypothetical protein